MIRPLRPVLALSLTVGLGLAAMPAAGQLTPEPPEDYAALGLGRVALLDLRTQADPTEADFRIAMLALDLARTYAPEDALLLRRQIEAAWSAGEDDTALALTRELLKIDPADEVALLRVIATGIERIQTVEERLSAYERLLGAESLTPAIRSRLALDAALLARETGNERQFVDLLATSTELDSSNKVAAALALAYFDSVIGDPVGRLDMLANLLLADPVDPNVHVQISDHLSRGGAFEQAIRFHDHAQRLLLTAGFAPQQADVLRRVHLQWLAYGPEGLANELELPVLQERSRLEQMLQLMVQRGEDIQGFQRPSDILPPPDSAMLRMLLAQAEGDPGAASRASEDLRGATAQRMQQMLLATQGNREQAREVALLATRVRAETAITMTIAGVQSALVRADTRQAREAMDRAMADEALIGEIDPAMIEPARQQLDLSLALIDTIDAVGTPEAETRLEDLRTRWQEQNVPMSPLAYVHALIVHGKLTEAVPILRELAASEPASMWGAWAHQKLMDLGVGSPFSAAEALASAAATIPAWLDRMVEAPQNFMELTVRSPSPEEHATSITHLRLTLRNNSPIPLAVGPNAPINSRILLSPVLDADLDRLTPVAVPEVASVDTRLRLMPRERLEIDVWAGAGVAGWYLEATGARTTRTRWRALQGFIITPNAGYQPGPMCLTAETGIITRRPLPETRFEVERIITRLLADDPAVLSTISTALKSVLIGPDVPPRGLNPEPFVPIMNAAAQRLAGSDALAQVNMLVAMPNGRMSRPAAPFDRLALDAATEAVPLAAALLTRASDPEDPTFARALEHDDERVRTLAALLQQRLRTGVRTYANFQGFGAPQVQPPSEPSADAATP